MNSTTTSPSIKPSRINKLSIPEMHELRAEGFYYYNLSYIPRGRSDRAIYAVGQYLWGTGYGRGFEEERLELLNDWFFSRREVNKPNEITRWQEKLRRFVYWKPEIATAELADETIDRMFATKKNIYDFRRANIWSTNRARTRIQRGYEEAIAAGVKITRNEIARRSGCSVNTVTKHSDIWKLSNRSSDITPAVEAVICSEKAVEAVEAVKVLKAVPVQAKEITVLKVVETETALKRSEPEKILVGNFAGRRKSTAKLSKHNKKMIRLQLGIEPKEKHERKKRKKTAG